MGRLYFHISGRQLLVFVLAFLFFLTFYSAAVSAFFTGSLSVPVVNDSTINIGETVSGAVGAENQADLYSIEITQNGVFSLSLKGNIRTSGYLRLYDVDGKTQIKAVQVVGREPVTIETGLYPGTYFIKVERSKDEWNYQLDSSFKAYPQDAEPDNVFQDAASMDLNSAATGFIGFTSHGFTDTEDWWKLTTEESGLLTVTLTSGSENVRGNLRLYDVDGNTQLNSDTLDSAVHKTTAGVNYNLKPGTYYIRVERTANFWEYTLNNSFAAASLENDPESNDYWTVATALAPGGSATGQIGYYTHGYNDTEDWWKVTTNRDGALTVNLSVAGNPEGARGTLYLYSPDWGETKTASFNVNTEEYTASATSSVLRPGTFYAKVVRTAGDAWCYTISSSLEPGTAERLPAAASLAIEDSITGNIDKDNREDWYTVTTTQNGNLALELEASTDPGCYLRLYDVNGTKQLTSQWINSTVKGGVNYNLAPGTYYVKVERFYNTTFSYTLNSSFTPAPLQADAEPNDVFTSANTLPLNGSLTGHIGYYSNNQTDSADWYKITTVKNGNLTVGLEASTDPGCYLRLYDVNGTKQLTSQWISSTVKGSANYNLAPGTYYVKVERFYNTTFSYTLNSSFTPAPLQADAEPNDVFTSANTLPLNGSLSGYIGYYSNNQTDSADWYKITTAKNGNLTVGLEAGTDPGCYLRLYDVNGTKVLATQWISSTVKGSVNYDLAPGTYYVKVERFYSTTFSYTLSNSFVPAPLPGDKELNNHPETALAISTGRLNTGHIGYFSNNWIDDVDWYKVNLPAEGTFVANLSANINPNAYLRIYDGEMNQKASVSVNSLEPRSAVAQNLEAGTYYIKVERFYNITFSYILTTTFTTGTPGNPSVLAAFPSNGATVSIQDFVTATFSELMDPDTFNKDTFTLKDSSGNTVAGTVGCTGTIASYYPDWPLEVDKTYTATITTGVKNTAGKNMLSPYSWTFTVGTSDIDPGEPKPSNDASLSDLRWNNTTVMGFSPGTKEYNVSLPAGTTEVPTVAAAANHNKASVIVNQAVALPGTAEVRVTAEDGTVITYKINFTVADSGIEWHELEPKLNQPVNKTWNVRFSHAIDAATVNQSTIYIEDRVKKRFPVDYQVLGSIVKVAPGQDFSCGETYTIYVSEEIKAVNGSKLLVPVKMEFTIID